MKPFHSTHRLPNTRNKTIYIRQSESNCHLQLQGKRCEASLLLRIGLRIGLGVPLPRLYHLTSEGEKGGIIAK